MTPRTGQSKSYNKAPCDLFLHGPDGTVEGVLLCIPVSRTNLPRVLPSGVKAVIDLESWPIPSIFKYLAKVGEIDTDELLQAFNMGIGMIVIVPSAYVKEAEADLKRRREKFYRIGRIEKGDTGKARVVYSGSLNL